MVYLYVQRRAGDGWQYVHAYPAAAVVVARRYGHELKRRGYRAYALDGDGWGRSPLGWPTRAAAAAS